MLKSELVKIVGEDYVIDDPVNLQEYTKNRSVTPAKRPNFAVKTGNTEEVQKIVKLCNKQQVPVIPVSSGVHFHGEAIPEQGGIVDSLLGTLTFSSITGLPNDFFINLKALVTKGRARVRANPRIATVSGQKASIFIGQQQFLSTPITLPDEGTTNSIDAGVSLEMTPYTGGEGEITFRAIPGEKLNYIDGSAEGKAVSIEYEPDGIDLSIGEPVEFEDIVI